MQILWKGPVFVATSAVALDPGEAVMLTYVNGNLTAALPAGLSGAHNGIVMGNVSTATGQIPAGTLFDVVCPFTAIALARVDGNVAAVVVGDHLVTADATGTLRKITGTAGVNSICSALQASTTAGSLIAVGIGNTNANAGVT